MRHPIFCLTLFILLFSPVTTLSQENFHVNKTETTVKLITPYKMHVIESGDVTVFNKEGDYIADFYVPYNSRKKIKKIYVRYTGENGQLLKNINKRDFKDYAAAGDYTLYTDNRVLVYDYKPSTYPFTVNYYVEYETTNTAFIPSWEPVPGFDAGVTESTYTLEYPAEIKIRTLEKNLDKFGVQVTKTPGKITYWIMQAEPVAKEAMAPGSIFPYVRLTANKFSLAGIKARVENWNDFGKWYYKNMLEPTDNLSEETRAKIKAMVAGIPRTEDKIKKIYEYMQDRTHYVNIAIDIGGWKPMKTDEVDRLGYGDCKALTFYTQSLLKVAGIPANYTIVYGGVRKDIEESLPGVQGNHVILNIPLEKDTIWLECTSQKIAYNCLGGFTNGRKAISIEQNGASIIQTPSLNAKQNLKDIRLDLHLETDGSVSGKIIIENHGIYYNRAIPLLSLSEKDRMKHYLSYLDAFHQPEIEKIEIKHDKANKKILEIISLKAKKYAIKINAQTFLLSTNPVFPLENIPPAYPERKLPFQLENSRQLTLHYNISLPSGMQVAFSPEDRNFSGPFGKFSFHLVKKDSLSFQYTLQKEMKEGIFPAGEYNAYRKFEKNILKTEKQKFKIIKQ